ncbi:PDZ and LIM domain protein Zasp isoform X2 [Maniola jurtina]|uniref:PDZ and LIM domain protein Zasp isoform X2 n=1 Tax=Maniola jurtina TaxID=191418 RepID=UPI001E688679|nr:PDZ and LIM domain protein Zasp isoform X2 [Maniola jurtina]
MAQLITVRLNKSDQQPLGFRLQGGKDFGTPLVVQKVNGGGAAERAGLQAGDALIRVNNTDVYTLRHQEAQDTIRAAGPTLELTVQRGGGTWRPAVTPTGSLPRPGSKPLGGSPVPVTNTSLKATPQPTRAFGSGHNSVAKPFGYMNGSDSVKSIVNKQYNTPVNMYSDKTIAETLSAQTEVLAGGVLGVNFKKNEKTYDAEKSAVFKVLQEAENDPEPEPTTFLSRARVARTGSPSVALRAQAAARSARERLPPRPASASLAPGAPHRPSIPVGSHRVLSDGRVALGAPAPAPPQLAVSPPPTTDTPYCSECNRNIDGVFVRIKDKNLHVECFKCATCGSSLKNQGYYNINGKLYCDIHAKLVARQNPPAPNLEPVTVSPGGRIPTNAYSTPLPPLSTNNYTNGSSSMFSPSSNLSGPKPFGSSIGSAYSPASLSPRSAPLSPARPLAAPAAPSPAIPAATPFAPNNNTKSIVWPPPFPPEDEPQTEINPSKIQKLPCSDITSSVQEAQIVIPDSNLNSRTTETNLQTKSAEQNSSSSQQKSEYSSNTTYETAITSSSTSKSESIVQSQQSQSIKELSSCTVQSFSQAASSHESQSFSIYETQEASELNNNRLLCEVNTVEKSTKPKAKENQTSDKSISNAKDINSGVKEIVEDIESKYQTNTAVSTLDRNTISKHNYSVSLGEDTTKKREISDLTETNVNAFLDFHKDTPAALQTESPQSDMAMKQSHNIFKQEPKPLPLPPSNRQNKQRSLPSQTTPQKPQNKSVNAKTTPQTNSSTSSQMKNSNIVRGSLLEALTIAPDRPFSPLAFNIPNQHLSSSSTSQNQSIPSDNIFSPAMHTNSDFTINEPSPKSSELSTMQKTGLLQTSSGLSAFKPVSKQTFPPPSPSEFSAMIDGSQINKEMNQFSHMQQESLSSQTKFTQNVAVSASSASTTQGFSTINTAENYLQQSNKQESSTFAITKSGFHRPEIVPPYQQKIEPQLPFRSGPNPAMQQTPVAPIPVNPQKRQNIPEQNKLKNKEPSSLMTFQPVVDETMQRISPVRSRPTTPSLINKPAPIIPPYQMNLVTMEHAAPESRMYSPAREEPGQSLSSKGTCRSPFNPLKAQAPRIKENSIQYPNLNQGEIQNQPPIVREQRESNVGYQSQSYNKGDMKIKEDSMFNQNYGQRQQESQNVSEYGNTTVQTTRKTYEEFERAQSAKVIEIQKGGSRSSGSYQQVESNSLPSSNMSIKQVFPPTVSNLIPSQPNLSFNTTNENVITASKQAEFYQPTPLISGANQGPVCDPTPSTGSSVGAATRGKTFGVSSAPKRGRGVLNKAALPGSRVPLCGSCNGNIRGPFITALGRIWCPEHFICVNATCRRQLQDIGFVEENGQLYCEYCFEQYIAPACDKCHAKIKGDCLNAIGKHFHPECFSCVYCGKLFGNNPFFLEDGLPYCEADWNELFTTKCFACGFPVEAGDRWVEALNNNYHSQCFNCTVCKKNLEGQSFFAKGGRPFCKLHAR